jgi:hypothetical protein
MPDAPRRKKKCDERNFWSYEIRTSAVNHQIIWVGIINAAIVGIGVA